MISPKHKKQVRSYHRLMMNEVSSQIPAPFESFIDGSAVLI